MSISSQSPAPPVVSNLTASQRLMWTGQQLQPQDPLYNMALVFRIEGDIDSKLLQRAFAQLVDTSDAMRTVISASDGVPQQRVLAASDAKLQIHDLRAAADPVAMADAWVQERVRKPFDLAQCLFDSALLVVGKHSYLWYFNQHHVITDAWSVAQIFARTSEIYLALEQDEVHSKQPLPQFSDYLKKEFGQRQSPAFEKSASYWRRLDLPSASEMEFYRPQASRVRGFTERVTLSLGPDRTQRLRKLVSTPPFQSLSVDMALQQAFATVLFAYINRIAGLEQILVGTPAHNRTTKAYKQTVGPFIDMFPMSVSVADQDSFSSLYQRVALAARQVLLHSAPGSCESATARSFKVVLNYITAHFGRFAGCPTQSDWIHAGAGDRNHVLRLQVHDFDRDEPGVVDDIQLNFDANVDVFNASDRQLLQRHFLCLFDALLEAPEQDIQAVPLVTEAEKSELQQQLSGPPLAVTATVLDDFARIVQQQPTATAAVHNDVRLTYAELDAATNTVVEQLRALNLPPAARVALLMPRGFGLLAGILGVLKSGAAFLPIDDEYPQGRVERILQNAKPHALLVTRDSSPGALNSTAGSNPKLLVDWALQARIPVLEVDPSHRQYYAQGSEPVSVAELNQLAYVLHTSGSTGEPKGVMVRHDALANYVSYARRTYLGSSGEPLVFPLFTSIGFDLTLTSIFAPLTSGGQVVIYTPRSEVREILLQRVVADNRVNSLKLTPSHLALLLAMDLAGSKIQTLVVGGESLRTDLANQVVQRLGSTCVLYNEYGPTEATVGCVVHRYQPETDQELTVPIGLAMDNVTLLNLNSALQWVPKGVVGNLWVSGVGVAQGYLHRPDLTNLSFQPNPFQPGTIMYNTGDLVRLQDSGELVYQGRKDQQVKIRGVRIELTEVESVLLQHPSISDAVVVVAHNDAQEERFCLECGLDGRHPDAQIDDSGVCQLCQLFAQEQQAALGYFRPIVELERMVPELCLETASGPDCIMLLSGGKDSSYALCRVVEMGIKPLVFTLDNGFISSEALDNVQRIVDKYGLELHVGKTPAMNDIFVDSLQRFSNVCNGCFKTIYTLSMNLAHERGIKTILTGLSRGQIFETRLAEFFKRKVFDAQEIDRQIIEARKIYHRMDDAVTRALNTDIYADEAVFEDIRFIDFYRYCDVTLDEVYRYLASRVSWIRPSDTGRSTNCLINEAGIHVHKAERGFHNYALPYSWDVRLGHKQRDAARAELDDDINHESVVKILGQIGYVTPKGFDDAVEKQHLVAYYVAASAVPDTQLREHLRNWLPSEMVPRHYVHLATLPLSINGKLELTALPSVLDATGLRDIPYVAPRDAAEVALCRIWQAVLGVSKVGVEEDFFDLGGDSILNIQIVAQARAAGIVVSPEQIFEFTTIAKLAKVSRSEVLTAQQGEVVGPMPLLPMQARFFAEAWANPATFAHVVHLQLLESMSEARARELLLILLARHDGLRAAFRLRDAQWQQTLLPGQAVDVLVATQSKQESLDALQSRLLASLSIADGQLVAAGLYAAGDRSQLLLVIHHLAVDAVSWGILLDDFAQLAASAQRDADQLSPELALPAKTMSLPAWCNELSIWLQTGAAKAELEYWRSQADAGLSVVTTAGSHRVARRDREQVSVRLPVEQTSLLLGEVARAYKVQVPELLLCALSIAVADAILPEQSSATTSVLRVDIETHGRERFSETTDVLRTVGWFTALYPLLLPVAQYTQPTQVLRSVREALRAVPNRGAGYGVLRAVHKELAEAPLASVLFNYLGQWSKTLQQSRQFEISQPLTLHADLESSGAYPLEINAVVFAAQLQVDFSYAPKLVPTRQVAKLSEVFLSTLTSLVDARNFSALEAPAPSDFPQVQLSQDDLDDLLAEFGEEG